MTERFRNQLVGAAGLAVVVAMVAVLVGMYAQVFTDKISVSLLSDRTGLLLDKGAAVRVNGVQVGQVAGARATGSGADIAISIDPDQAKRIPADSVPRIMATTVFGNKFVDLDTGGRRGDPVSNGTRMTVAATTIEANDVFQHALDVIEAVRPTDLNQALTEVASALDGRGEELGDLLVGLNQYLASLEPTLPTLGRDFATAAGVVRAYSDATPELISTARNFGTTSTTLRVRQDDIIAALGDVTRVTHRVDGMLVATKNPLDSALTMALPVTGLAHDYAPAIGCVVDLLVDHGKIFNKALGGWNSSMNVRSTFMPGRKPYSYPEDKFKFVTGLGPRCYPGTAQDPTPAWVSFDDGTAGSYSQDAGLEVNDTPATLYGDMLRDFLGDSGAAELLKRIAADQRADASGKGTR